MTKLIVALGALFALALGPAHGGASVTVVTAAGLMFIPGSPHSPVPLLVRQGSTLQFVNFDPLGWHAIVSTTYDENGDPAFSSRPIGSGMTTQVNGVEPLVPGDYSFVCPIHYGMAGSLTVFG